MRARFPHFDGFHPKFSAGTSPFLLSPPDLHNILEILYKISFLSFSLFPYVGLTRYCLGPRSAPIAMTDDARCVKRIDRKESAQKKFVKHRGIREIRVDAM